MVGKNEMQGSPLLPSQKISEKKPVSGKQRKRGKTLRDAPRENGPLYGVFAKANFCGLKATKKPRASR